MHILGQNNIEEIRVDGDLLGLLEFNLNCVTDVIVYSFIVLDSYKYYKSQMFMPTFETTCTYCLENPLAMDIDSGSIIDQVLVRTPEGDIATYKTMVKPVY